MSLIPTPAIGENLGDDQTPQWVPNVFIGYDLTLLEDRYSGEINPTSVCALEKQVEGQEEISKRPRNSLLRIHRLPPEILGEIFHWNVNHMFKNEFPRFKRHSHNFMLVCRHWFNVAWHTPELWSFWGRTLEGWTRCYPRSAAAPVDIVLEDGDGDHDDLEKCEYFDATLSDLLRDRANLNIIRRVYLVSGNTRLLNTITSSLTPDAEQIRSNRMESFTLQNLDYFPAVVVDL